MVGKRKKSEIDDISRSIYDIKDEVSFSFKTESGLTSEIIREEE